MHSIKMRRNNKILLGLLAMLLVMSTGYALFSKEITIGGNVTAKGSFKIDLTCTKGTDDILEEYGNQIGGTSDEISQLVSEFGSMQHGYTTDTCSVSGSSVTMNTGLSYPGAGRFYTIEVKNSGDIPAKWSHVDGFSGTYTICDGSNASDCITEQMGEGLNTYDTLNSYLLGAAPMVTPFALKDASGAFTIVFEESIENIADADGYITLEPGESLIFWAYNVWKEDRDSDDYNYANGNYQKFNFTFNFNFEQATE